MRIAVLVCLCFFACAFQIHGQNHPGGMHPREQVDFVKKQLANKREPFLSAYAQLLRKADSILKESHHALEDFNVPGYYVEPEIHRANSLALQKDGFAAYCLALAYQLSGKKVYADKALYFLNAWGSVNKKYSNFDGPLVMSYSGTSMVMAAELMKNWDGWKKSDKDLVTTWVRDVYRKAANEIRNRKNNWADWGRFGSILSDYFLDDTADMAENVRLIKSDLFEKIEDDGHMPEETRREKNGIWYTYFSLAPITASCWVVYNATGENLFQFTKGERSLKHALDYLLYYQQHPAEWKWFKDPNTGSATAATGFWPSNLFEAMSGIYNDSSFLNFARPHRPVLYERHHFAWTFPTLMPVQLSPYSR